MSEELREKIARVIEPLAWSGRDEWNGECAFDDKLNRGNSLTKADSILALIDHLEADGMVLVPREPTEDMIEAGAMCEAAFGKDSEGVYYKPEFTWTAMLSALPVLGVGR